MQELSYKTPYADLEQFCQNYDHQGEYSPYFVCFKFRIIRDKRFKNIEFPSFYYCPVLLAYKLLNMW